MIRQEHDYETSSGPVAYGEIVATTRDKTSGLFVGPGVVEATPIYVVRLVGSFICDYCSTPPNARVPHGSEILFTHAPSATGGGAFSIGNGPTDLASLGTVYRLPQPTEMPPSGQTTSGNRTVRVVPDSSVAGGQSVAVTVTGFGLGDRVWLSECASAADANALGCGQQLLSHSFIVRGDGRAGPGSIAVIDPAPFAPGPDATRLRPCSGCVVMATIGDDGFAYAPVTVR